jgi:hypothetical protein
MNYEFRILNFEQKTKNFEFRTENEEFWISNRKRRILNFEQKTKNFEFRTENKELRVYWKKILRIYVFISGSIGEEKIFKNKGLLYFEKHQNSIKMNHNLFNLIKWKSILFGSELFS